MTCQRVHYHAEAEGYRVCGKPATKPLLITSEHSGFMYQVVVCEECRNA